MNPPTNTSIGAQPQVVTPELPSSDHAPGSSEMKILRSGVDRRRDTSAAAILAAHLFAQGDHDIPGVSYAVGYRLADVLCGGDIVDVYQFDNDAVAFSIADISGKGAEAAVHAALIKYGLRAYSSQGLNPEKAMRAMDRLYLENCSFESIESFATVFLGIVDPRRRMMTYASAGHEAVILLDPHTEPRVLPPTCPLIGVFDDQHHLFRQDHVELWPGSLLVATSDGITEARDQSGGFFGLERLVECVVAHRDDDPAQLLDAIVDRVSAFSNDNWEDDVAVLVTRFA
ncbi:MAG TPA: PP2C family protein-serine/threonine phosphatase [Candidatus Acidoferrales bacterium]|nr:PP2C family protein-serine/threonine phosphatase [Candidatus Acidoferrales bacterium]